MFVLVIALLVFLIVALTITWWNRRLRRKVLLHFMRDCWSHWPHTDQWPYQKVELQMTLNGSLQDNAKLISEFYRKLENNSSDHEKRARTASSLAWGRMIFHVITRALVGEGLAASCSIKPYRWELPEQLIATASAYQPGWLEELGKVWQSHRRTAREFGWVFALFPYFFFLKRIKRSGGLG